MTKLVLTPLLLSLTLFAGGCASCHPAEPPTVAEYLDLIKGATTELLAKEAAERGYDGGADRFKVAVTPVICTGALDLSSNRGAFQDGISRAITDSRMFLPINADIVARAMQKAGIGTAADLNFDAEKERFLSLMKSEGHYPEYWIFAKLNTLQTEREGCITELLVELDIRLVNSRTSLETSPGLKRIVRKSR